MRFAEARSRGCYLELKKLYRNLSPSYPPISHNASWADGLSRQGPLLRARSCSPTCFERIKSIMGTLVSIADFIVLLLFVVNIPRS